MSALEKMGGPLGAPKILSKRYVWFEYRFRGQSLYRTHPWGGFSVWFLFAKRNHFPFIHLWFVIPLFAPSPQLFGSPFIICISFRAFHDWNCFVTNHKCIERHFAWTIFREMECKMNDKNVISFPLAHYCLSLRAKWRSSGLWKFSKPD